MDITPMFFQILKSKKLEQNSDGSTAVNNPELKSSFNTKITELVASINYMKQYLFDNKTDYINIYNSILSMASTMTDNKRDQIDEDVGNFIKLCNDVIKILRVEIKSTLSKQCYEHQTNAVSMVEQYVKLINEFHNKQKAIRLRRNLDAQNFFRLSKPLKNEVDKFKSNDARRSSLQTSDSECPETSLRKRNIRTKQDANESKDMNNTSVRSQNASIQSTKNTPFFDDDFQDSQFEESTNFTTEEIQKFKTESDFIYQQMNSMNHEVKEAAKKLHEISKLQEAFSENVMKQEMDLNQLNTTTINSTESIRQGNESLRSAMRKNAAFRLIILFTTTLLAFVLLFLHWYND